MWLKSGLSLLGIGWGIVTGVLGLFCVSLFVSGGNAFLIPLVFLLGILPTIIFTGRWGDKLVSRLWGVLQDTAISRYKRRQKILTTVQIIIMLPALFIVLICSPLNPTTPPSDEMILDHFARHESTLNTVAQMAQQDKGLKRLTSSWTMPDTPERIGIPRSRITHYQQLLNTSEVPGGFRSHDTPEVDFIYFTFGCAVSSYTIKGLTYRAVPPPSINTLPSLDNCHGGPKVYRHIHGNWYLFYEYLPA